MKKIFYGVLRFIGLIIGVAVMILIGMNWIRFCAPRTYTVPDSAIIKTQPKKYPLPQILDCCKEHSGILSCPKDDYFAICNDGTRDSCDCPN